MLIHVWTERIFPSYVQQWGECSFPGLKPGTDVICTAAITTSEFITRSQCLEEFWKLPAGFVARWSCWQHHLHAES